MQSDEQEGEKQRAVGGRQEVSEGREGRGGWNKQERRRNRNGEGCSEEGGDVVGEVDAGSLALSKFPLPAFLSRKDRWDRMRSKVTSVPRRHPMVVCH